MKMTSLWHYIRRRCQWNRPVTNSVPLLYFCKQNINANQIHSEMHLVYGNKCLRSEQFTFGVKRMLGGQKFVSYTEMQSVVLQWHGQHCSLHRTFRSLLTDRTNVWANSNDIWQLIKYSWCNADIIMCHRYKLASLNWCCQLLPCFDGKLNLVRQ